MRILLIAVFLCFGVALWSQPGTCVSGNCTDGKGKFEYSDGAYYDGRFVGGKFHGIGLLRYPDGGVYAGHWQEGLQHGKGRMTQADGTQYFGYFVRGKREGEGTITFADGNRIVGNWQADQVAGAGEFRFANGDYYRGQITDARLEGQGTMEYDNGDYYVGAWLNSARHGFGKIVFENGAELEGQWLNDEFQADWTQLGFRGDPTSLPDCALGCTNGNGRINYPDGRIYRGEVCDNRPNGNGTVRYPNGNIYYGGFLNHKPEGLGIMHFADGEMRGGIWNNGRIYRRIFSATGRPAREITPDYDEAVKVWAVVVGAARYSHMRTLRYTDDDAYHLYAFLKSVEGGALPDEQVKILVDDDATHRNIQMAMREIFLRADENDVILFYFSGHGIPGAFLPVDFDGYNNQLEHYQLRDALLASRAKHKLVIADACHSGSLGGRNDDGNDLAARNNGAAEALAAYYEGLNNASASTALLLSSKGEEISLEDGGLRSGIFSHYLIRGMKGEADANQDQLVSIEELFGFVHREVRRYTGNIQTPTLTGVYDGRMPISVIRR
ncbi:caspase family protein [Lewinella sp. 4G2]|uniref:caspase family protein n=1 Tax=Lewinella sp. 4G2 TaxID=1803372 RepID=UPI0007B4D470|nr:caspase family protein [Lewinella sp. 4G2]OAV44745.1 peptidase C14 caspase catalytic subunit p20 [Lewinella sp. 4G2]